jgi:hypothetical protein
MTVRIDLLRPDDLLNLHIEGENLRLDADASGGPALVLEDPSTPGYLIVTFPPQTVVEEAVYESSQTLPPPLPPPPTKETGDLNTKHPPETPPALPMRSRIGGASRLVFRIPAGSQQSIPYDIEGLLDWSALELNVSALADVPAEPTAAQRNNAPAIAKPGSRDTAIELPYRLILSPNHAVAWAHAQGLKTRQGVTELWHTRLALKSDDGTLSELSRANPAPLRAIWSPDFNANKFLGTDPPLFGRPDSDWGAVPPGVLTPMTPSDRHEIVVLTSAFSGYVKDIDDFRSYEPQPVRAEQLMLSPLGGWLKSRGEWDPPATYRLPRFSAIDALDRWRKTLADLGDLRIRRAPDRDAASAAASASTATSSPSHDEASAPTADDLRESAHALSALAATDLTFGAAQFESVLFPQLLGKTGSLLNVSEWSHIATMGRDHFVRIVYEGHLFPFGHRAALVKITERKIRDVPLGSNTPVAYLVQRMFIVVRQPLRNYRAPEILNQLQQGGRGLPFRTIRLTTLVTPDIANPYPNGPCKVFPANPEIFSFWVRLGTGATDTDDFKFHALAEDIAGETIDFTCSLIFIPFSEDGLPPPPLTSNRTKVFQAYDKSGEARACLVPGQKLTYAPKGGKDNTTLTTQRLYFTSQPAPFNKTFGAFLPTLFKSSVKLPAIEALLGAPAETEIAFHPQYLDDLPGNTTGLFARVVKETSSGVLADNTLAAEFEAKKAGGFATPNLSISGLTRELGPMAGDATKIATDNFDPADFFKDMKDSAKLFGTFNLAELLDTLTMSAGAPKVQIQQSELPPPPPLLRLFKLTTTLDWEPKVQAEFSPLGGLVKFLGSRDNQPAKFAVHARIEKTVSVPPVADATAPIVDMEGALTNFRIELLHVVEILFERFAFTAKPGKKFDVAVALDSGTPVRFIDDLEFVEKLRETIPPGLFGDGPSLDINATRVKAGFSVGLPPVGVGVFALKDVAIGAFIELPFKDGKPVFDFGFSGRERPFNLTVAFLGGGGFFHLQVDTKGVKMLEAALEFGASASIDLGVASGGVHIMAGIYFSIERRTIKGEEVDAATLGGYLRLGGELSVLGIISVSLEFYLIFAYQSEGAKKYAYGRATLTVKVEVLMFSTSVEISVEKRFGGSGGDPHFLETFETPAIWTEYAGAFA